MNFLKLAFFVIVLLFVKLREWNIYKEECVRFVLIVSFVNK